jgi:hypothetical protein
MFVEVFMALIAFMLIFMAIAISCRLIELIWMAIFACFAPCMCPNRRREPWPAELCNLLIILIICIDNTLYKYCCIWCGHLNIKLRRCKLKLKLCKICVNKKLDKIRVKPIIYDDVHIIVVNPYDNYQIATVSKVVNAQEV